MCNEVARRIALGELRNDFSQVRITLTFPEGAPNMAPLDSVRITDTTVIVRAAPDPVGADAAADLVSRRWSWPGAGGRPVYNYRSDGRDFGNHGAKGGRCLIPVDSFFEFTAPQDAGQKRKDKWRFSPADADWLCIAGLWRADPHIGEAFTMLTCPPGPDVAPYHARQVVVMPRTDWGRWLDGTAPSQDLCQPSPPGTLAVTQVARPGAGATRTGVR